MKVEVQSRAGAFCARHERWHYDGRDEAIGIPVAYARAERCLTGTLWARGIGLDTGEIELACEIISTYREFVYRDNSTRSADQRLRDFYPDAVELTAFLTAPSALAFLRNRQIGHLPVAAMVEAAVTAVASRSRHRLSSVHGMFQASGRERRLAIQKPSPCGTGAPLKLERLVVWSVTVSLVFERSFCATTTLVVHCRRCATNLHAIDRRDAYAHVRRPGARRDGQWIYRAHRRDALPGGWGDSPHADSRGGGSTWSDTDPRIALALARALRPAR